MDEPIKETFAQGFQYLVYLEIFILLKNMYINSM